MSSRVKEVAFSLNPSLWLASSNTNWRNLSVFSKHLTSRFDSGFNLTPCFHMSQSRYCLSTLPFTKSGH